MDVSIYESPTKRPRIAPSATQFTGSPVSITKDEALQLNKSDRSHVHLRNISCEAISEIDASREAPQGFQARVLPQLFGTNKHIENLIAKQERFDTVQLYVGALYSSISLCAVDLTMVAMYLLDYHMRRLFLEKKKKAVDPKRYQALFVGKGKRKPFKGTSGDQIRYFYLLRCYMRLAGKDDVDDTDGEERNVGEDDDDDTDGEDTDGEERNVGEDDDDDTDGEERNVGEEKNVGYVNEQLECFQDLLQSSEHYLSAALSHCGATNVEASKFRDEALDFLEEKGLMNTGAHIFTELFHQQRGTPLEKQYLQDTVFPPKNDAVFRLTEPKTLARMGLKILALVDIEKRLNLPDASPFRLTLAAPTLMRAGVDIVKCFIMLKGNVNESIKFNFGSLSATMGESKPTKTIDILGLGC